MYSQSTIHHQVGGGWLERLAELPGRLARAVPVLPLPDIAQGILSGAPRSTAGPAPAAAGDNRLFNSGGPRSRTRCEPIVSSIFEFADGRLGARPVGGLHALWIGDGASAEGGQGFRHAAFKALRECGFEEAEAAFEALPDIPRKALHSLRVPPHRFGWNAKRPWKNLDGFLRTALILGKCSGGLYDPARPVIWTENRLSQWVKLYEIGEPFYAGDDDWERDEH